MPNIKTLLLAAFAVFFVSASMAQDVPKPTPKPDCITIDAALASHKVQGYPQPILRTLVKGADGLTLLVYSDRTGILAAVDSSGCITRVVQVTPAQVRKIIGPQA